MAMSPASPWLMHLRALPSPQPHNDREPHIRTGTHLRVQTHPWLGLPAAPFLIWRARVRPGQGGVDWRRDVLFMDQDMKVLTPPFELHEGMRVTARPLVQGEVCIYAQVVAGQRRRTGNITATAYVTTPEGKEPAGVIRQPPHAFGAPGLVEVELTGEGVVRGMAWLAQELPERLDFEPVDVLALPHLGGPRYLSIAGAPARAEARVGEQAPKRRPLQETTGRVSPGDAPSFDPTEEQQRVRSLVDQGDDTISDDLDSLINDTDASPWAQTISHDVDEVSGAQGENRRQVTMHRMARVLQSQLDPGAAAWLGYKGLDPSANQADPTVVIYVVEGYFRVPSPGELPGVHPHLLRLMHQTLRSSTRFRDPSRLADTLERRLQGFRGHQLEDKYRRLFKPDGELVGMTAMAAVHLQATPEPPQAPRVQRTQHQGWLPALAPEARREVSIRVHGVGAGHALAAEKTTSGSGGGDSSLNPANRFDTRLPLVLGEPPENDEQDEPAAGPGQGDLFDRRGAAASIRYAVAQQDPFGRWSKWHSAMNEPAPRPRPPRPVLRATYSQPDAPATEGGMLRIAVNVPPRDTLAPGGYLLAALRVEIVDHDGGTDIHEEPLPDAMQVSQELEELVFKREGPVLDRAESDRRITLRASWLDTEGRSSEESEPQTLRLHDPRAPEQLAVPDKLLYAARPDVNGIAWVEHTWPADATASRHAVYYSDENRLHAHLQQGGDSGEQQLLEDIEAAETIAERATLYRNNPGLFPEHLFERLDDVVEDLPGGNKGFRHALSGSLRVLNFYRISAESASGGREPLESLPLLVKGIPSDVPPAKPRLEVSPVLPENNQGDYAALLRVTLADSPTPGARWRLRRSSLSAQDPLRMPLVTAGDLPSADGGSRQQAEVTDDGPVAIAPDARLKPWVQYDWVVEVQGQHLPGSKEAGAPVKGLWSRPSDPATVILVPPEPPAKPEEVELITTAADGAGYEVSVQFAHPETLSGGTMGSYVARLFRKTPGGRTEALPEQGLSGNGPFTVPAVAAADGDDGAPYGTRYTLMVVDPLGRAGPAEEITLEEGP